jgi:hypothetical protein
VEGSGDNSDRRDGGAPRLHGSKAVAWCRFAATRRDTVAYHYLLGSALKIASWSAVLAE